MLWPARIAEATTWRLSARVSANFRRTVRTLRSIAARTATGISRPSSAGAANGARAAIRAIASSVATTVAARISTAGISIPATSSSSSNRRHRSLSLSRRSIAASGPPRPPLP